MMLSVVSGLLSVVDSGVSPEAVGGIIASLVVALIGGGYLGKRAANVQRVRLGEPVPEIPVRRVSSPPSWDQHIGLERRVGVIEHAQSEMRRDMAIQFRELLEAGGTRELRIMEKLDGIATGIHSRIDRMLAPTTRKP